MSVLKDIYGATVSALITLTLFLGPAIAGILSTLFPTDRIESLVMEERPPVYFDGAFELSTVEEDGDLNGTAELDAPKTDAADANDGANGTKDGDTPPDKATTNQHAGADVLANPNRPTSGRGVSAGSRLGQGKAARGSGAKGRKRKRSRKRCPKSIDGVALREDGIYELRRDIVNFYTSSLKNFNSLGWSKSNDNGKGWIISGFDCRGPMWHGGMRRGDIVLSVNGKKTNNMLQVLRLYPKLKAQRRFEVSILRKGRPLVLHYEIVGK